MVTMDSYRSGRVHAITRSPLITRSRNKSMIGKIPRTAECVMQNSRLPVQFPAMQNDTIGIITITAKHKSMMFRDNNNSRVTEWMFFIRRKTTILITLMKMVKNATIVKIVALIHANHTGTGLLVGDVWLLNAVKFSIITDLVSIKHWKGGRKMATVTKRV